MGLLYKYTAKALLFITTCSLCLIVVNTTVQADEGDDTITLTYATYMSNAATATKLDTWFMDEVERRSHGKIHFERYYGGSLLGAVDVFPGLSRGAVDLASGAPFAYNKKHYPLGSIALPYITNKADAVTYALDDLYQANETYRSQYTDKNIKLLWRIAYPDGQLWGNYKPSSPIDMEGERIRAARPVTWLVQKLDGVLVSMSFSEAAQAYARGVIDGFMSAPFDSAVFNGLNQASTFVTAVGGVGIYSASSTGINMDTFKSLPTDMQKLIEAVARDALDKYVELVNDSVTRAAKQFVNESAGKVSILRLDPNAKKEFQTKMSKHIQERWLDSVSDNNEERHTHHKLLDKYISLVKKYEKTSNYIPGLVRINQLMGKSHGKQQ